ncbi:MAG TPA: hypothetical protein VEL75_14145, partial [Candidatus Methylomirabilis sp.]|nr:hypothetical protein [Candidatus Methylomirabilis sp.]
VDPERTTYVKCRATGEPLIVGGLARFQLAVEEVAEDAADPSEGDVRITSGITYGPPPRLDNPRARLTLDTLRRE